MTPIIFSKDNSMSDITMVLQSAGRQDRNRKGRHRRRVAGECELCGEEQPALELPRIGAGCGCQWALYDFCMTFCWFIEKKARDGKGMEAHWRKTGLSVKPLIYLGKINGSPQK